MSDFEDRRIDATVRAPSRAVAEVAHVRATAERIARGEGPEGGDPVRVLAGLIQQLAEQVERLSETPSSPLAGDETLEREIATEEGRDALDPREPV